MTKPPNALKRLEERLTKTAKYPSFPAYLRADFEAFSKTIGLGGRDKWDEIAAWAVEERLTGGKVIKGSAAKSAYEREKRRRANEAATKQESTVKFMANKAAAETRLNALAADKPTPPAPAPTGTGSAAARARFNEQMKQSFIRKKPKE